MKFCLLIIILLLGSIEGFLMDTRAETGDNLIITGEGRIGIGSVVENQVCISIDEYNELTPNAKWRLLGAYIKENVYMTLWENKKTGEKKEGIGTECPSEQIFIDINHVYGCGECPKTKLHIQKEVIEDKLTVEPSGDTYYFATKSDTFPTMTITHNGKVIINGIEIEKLSQPEIIEQLKRIADNIEQEAQASNKMKKLPGLK